MEPAEPSQNQPVPPPGGKLTLWFHWPLTILAALSLVAEIVMLWQPRAASPASNWPDALLLSLMAATTVFALSRQLPWQNTIGAVVIIALLGGGAHALDERTDLPFGPFLFGPAAGPKLFTVLPWWMPLVWVVVLLNSRGVARLMLRPWRKTKSYGYWLMGLTAALAAMFDLALDPFAGRLQHYWIWEQTRLPITWFGAPLVNFAAWAVVSLLILAIATPFLISKQPKRRSSVDYHPLGVWSGLLLFFALASATGGLWLSVVADALLIAVTAIFSIRGARW